MNNEPSRRQADSPHVMTAREPALLTKPELKGLLTALVEDFAVVLEPPRIPHKNLEPGLGQLTVRVAKRHVLNLGHITYVTQCKTRMRCVVSAGNSLITQRTFQ